MKIARLLIIISLTPFLLAASCEQAAPPSQYQSDAETSDWTDLTPAAQKRRLIVEKDQHRYRFEIYRLKKEAFSGMLVHDTPRSLEQWGVENQADLVINGGYFSELNEPTGWTVINGTELQSHQYDFRVSGIVQIENGRIDLVDTMTQEPPEIGANTSVVQSFPPVIRARMNAIATDSGKIARRTVLAEDSENRLLIIIVDQTPISLFELGEVLENSDLDITFALNLDGGPSTGLWSRLGHEEQVILSLGPLPQAVIFQERPQD